MPPESSKPRRSQEWREYFSSGSQDSEAAGLLHTDFSGIMSARSRTSFRLASRVRLWCVYLINKFPDMKNDSNLPTSPDRRKFITTAGATAAAGALSGVVKGQAIDPSKKIKIGFVGTGGRGTGAAKNALSADDNCELWSVADVFQDRIDTSLEI